MQRLIRATTKTWRTDNAALETNDAALEKDDAALEENDAALGKTDDALHLKKNGAALETDDDAKDDAAQESRQCVAKQLILNPAALAKQLIMDNAIWHTIAYPCT